jgi:hypothetical protein
MRHFQLARANPVHAKEQPAGETLRNFVKAIASRSLRSLHQMSLKIPLQLLPELRASLKFPQCRRFNAKTSTRYLDKRPIWHAAGIQKSRKANHTVFSHNRYLNRRLVFRLW